ASAHVEVFQVQVAEHLARAPDLHGIRGDVALNLERASDLCGPGLERYSHGESPAHLDALGLDLPSGVQGVFDVDLFMDRQVPVNPDYAVPGLERAALEVAVHLDAALEGRSSLDDHQRSFGRPDQRMVSGSDVA